MYTIYSDNSIVYAPNLSNPEDGGYAVVDPVVSKKLNSSGSATFKIPHTNPMYDGIQKLKSVIKIYDERQTENGVSRTRIFRGRVLNDESDFWNRKNVYAEGELSFFNDSTVRPYTFTGSVADYFAFLVNQHNSQVDADKQFAVGNCTVTDPNNQIVRASSDYPKTLKEMQDKLLGLLGGYLVPRYEVENGQEVEYLDYLAESGGISGQTIIFAENILDLSQYIDASDIYTVIIPLGKADDDTGVRLTIKEVNDGKDYLESETGISLFGRISHMEPFDDVTQAENLKAKGAALLESSILLALSINISAFDLHLLDIDTEALAVGKYNRVISPPHGIDANFQCVEAKVNLKDMDKSEYTFGSAVATLVGNTIKNESKTGVAINAATAANIGANAAANALNIALGEIVSDYVTKTEFDALAARVTALEGN
jgi:hypothetical protein